jgi:GntR family transcriptional regulator
MAFDRAGGWTGTAATRYDGPRGDVSSGSAFTEDQVIMEYHFVKVDRNKAIPLYYQVSEHLEQLIQKGEIRPNERILPEDLLAERYEVSRPTINKAIEILIRKSILRRERGKGTFARSAEVRLTLMQELASLHEAMRKNNIPFRTVVLELRRQKGPKNVAERLGCENGVKIFYLKRLRYVEDEPFLLSESYLPQSLFPDLDKVDFSDRSLYDLLEQKYDIPIIKTERYARAMKAFEEDASLLRVPLGDPLIQLEGVAFSARDMRVEYFNTRIRGDRGVLCTTLIRKREAHRSRPHPAGSR